MFSELWFFKRMNMGRSIAVDFGFLGGLICLFALQTPPALIAASFLCCMYVLWVMRPIFHRVSNIRSVFLIFSFFFLMHVIGGKQGVASVFYLFSTILCFYAALGFSAQPIAHIRTCLSIVFWIFFVLIVIGFWVNCGEAEPLGAIIPGSSTNGLPSYLIVVQVALSISVLAEKERLPLFPAVAILFVAILGVGRGSIIVAFMITLFSLFFNLLLFQRQYRYRLFYVVWFVLLCIIAGVIGYVERVGWSNASLLISGPTRWVCAIKVPKFSETNMSDQIAGEAGGGGGNVAGAPVEVQKVGSTTKWAWGVKDPARAEMLREYWKKLDYFSLWFGANYDGTSIVQQYEGNPHSSYIRLHSHYGLPGVLLVLLSPFLILARRKNLYLKSAVFFLVFFVLLRATTEPILFPTVLDFFYFLYFFIYFNHIEDGQV